MVFQVQEKGSVDCPWREGKLVRWVTQYLKWKIILDETKSRLEPTDEASQAVLVVKNPPASAGDTRYLDLIPGSGRPPGGGHGDPLKYSCLENPMDRGALRATVHGVAKSWTRRTRLSMRACKAYRRKDQWIWKHQLKLSIKKYTHRKNTRKKTFDPMPKPLTVWITISCGKFWKTWEHQTT